MPTFKKTHEENRKFVCFYCGKKATKELGQAQIDHIKTFYAEFDAHRQLLPYGLCDTCRLKKTLALGKLDYAAIVQELKAQSPMQLRSDSHSCTICGLATSTVRQKKAAGRPAAPPVVTSDPEPPDLQFEPPVSPPTTSFKQMMSAPLDERLRVTSATLKELSGGKPGSYKVKTGGPPLTVHIGPLPKAKPPPLPIKKLEKLHHLAVTLDVQTSVVSLLVFQVLPPEAFRQSCSTLVVLKVFFDENND